MIKSKAGIEFVEKMNWVADLLITKYPVVYLFDPDFYIRCRLERNVSGHSAPLSKWKWKNMDAFLEGIQKFCFLMQLLLG